MRRVLPPLLLLVLAGCASSTDGRQPSVTVTQMTIVEPVQVSLSTPVPVDYRLDVINHFDYPVTLKSVELETVGLAGGYSMRRVRHRFAETIAARASTAIDLRAWVQPLQVTNMGAVVTSVMLRGVAQFDANGRTVKTAFSSRARQ